MRRLGLTVVGGRMPRTLFFMQNNLIFMAPVRPSIATKMEGHLVEITFKSKEARMNKPTSFEATENLNTRSLSKATLKQVAEPPMVA
jgi:hypothetical protein